MLFSLKSNFFLKNAFYWVLVSMRGLLLILLDVQQYCGYVAKYPCFLEIYNKVFRG